MSPACLPLLSNSTRTRNSFSAPVHFCPPQPEIRGQYEPRANRTPVQANGNFLKSLRVHDHFRQQGLARPGKEMVKSENSMPQIASRSRYL
eukprot:scaffold502747_cov18-Prasinocladus_malaysianus.AAC.1